MAESTSEWMNDSSSQKRGNYHDADFSSQYGTDRFAFSTLFPFMVFEFFNHESWFKVASNSTHKFSLKMPDVDLNSSISEGVGGIIRRSILSKGGVLQVYYVKVLEKGDTYEVSII